MKYLALSLFLVFSTSLADSGQVKEMTLPTDVGEVVLTMEPCPLPNELGFDYYAYATEFKNHDHIGCWNADDEIVQIWFINEKIVAVYKKTLFKPRLSV